jgi:hypothetical protein
MDYSTKGYLYYTILVTQTASTEEKKTGKTSGTEWIRNRYKPETCMMITLCYLFTGCN